MKKFSEKITTHFFQSQIALSTFLAFFFLFSTAAATRAAPGDLDATFGNGGKVITNFSDDGANGQDVVVQPDGKILALTVIRYDASPTELALIRYNQNGSLDTSFGNNGKVSVIVGGILDFMRRLVIRNNKILVVGSAIVNIRYAVVMLRLNLDGTRDTSFGTNGQAVITNIGPDNSNLIYSLVIQPDGKIVTGGRSYDYTIFRTGFLVARFNENGSLDTTFNGSGYVITRSGDRQSDASAVDLQVDGKIIAVGSEVYDDDEFAIIRYNSNGSLDNSFGTNGKVITSFGEGQLDSAGNVKVLPDGKILVAGRSTRSPLSPQGVNDDIAVARYNSDGTLDPTFGTGGQLRTSFTETSSDFANALLVQPNGKFIIAGTTVADRRNYYETARVALVRYNSNGSLDTSFGNGGLVANQPANGIGGEGESAALQSDGKIVVVGNARVNPSFNNLALIRYSGDVKKTAFDFDGDGKADYGVFRPSNGNWYLQQSQSGFAAAQFGSSTDKLAPADYDGDGQFDIAVFRDGIWFLQRSTAGFTSAQFGSPGDIPVPADYDGDGKADIAVFRPSNGTWYRVNSFDNSFVGAQFGATGDIPQPADFDGDGKDDINVFRPSNGFWYRLYSSNGSFAGVQFGAPEDVPTAADYDGDGKADLAVFRPSNGFWYRLDSQNGQFAAVQWGASGDIPTAADYDGDGKTDFAVFRNGNWYLQQTTAGPSSFQFGAASDKPVSAVTIP